MSIFGLKGAGMIFPAVGGNAALSWIFLQALFDPLSNRNLLANGGISFFAIEFLAIHSGVMLSQESDTSKGRLGRMFLVGMYGLMALGIGAADRNFVPAGVFVTSLASKVLFQKAEGRPMEAWTSALAFMASLAFAFAIAPVIYFIAPFPAEISREILKEIQGMKEPYVATFVIWGIVYYAFTGALPALMRYIAKFGVAREYITRKIHVILFSSIFFFSLVYLVIDYFIVEQNSFFVW